ncbi:formimidoyltransferase-cyclodeaminase-like [Daphnia pulicaria]|uniref:formimidoyltransferase-cyclodeaminase-like n=1 Tax=Daphnia pulicaria TaxID=35523 RepID=UPI001EEB2C5B|nr:formimidoyltransferase-cyclodeaminase-like [Daphnia pulicaria]
MSKIVECVPNFSEGRDPQIIEAISTAIRSVTNVSLLDVDPGTSTNRTVYTFVGSPSDVVEAALAASRVAYQLIDMARHKGEHPRMGALDVCPFIPVQGVDVEDCIRCAKEFGRRLATELSVPVYLYGMAAEKGAHRVTLPQIRAGEYEAISQKINKEEWKPDFGPSEFVSRWGATATGVRKFLIAFNVNVLGTKEQAHRIALNLREQGRGPNEPGRLKAVQGIGWWLEEAQIAQISLNLTDHDVTPIHTAYEEARKDAGQLNVAITGSEIVGLIPLKAILQAADYYVQKEKLMVLEEEQRVRLAIDRLGLAALHPFNPKERIIEYRMNIINVGPLARLSVEKFVLSVGARTSAPGGGSVAALLAGLGCGLSTMVGQMTYGKRQFEDVDETIRQLLPPLYNAMIHSVPMIDADTDAFNDYMNAMKLSPEAGRESAMDAGLRQAINVPLNLAKHVDTVWDTLVQMAAVGNINCKSDLQVAARCLKTAVQSAGDNVIINLSNIKDETYKVETRQTIDRLVEKARAQCRQVLDVLDKRG